MLPDLVKTYKTSQGLSRFTVTKVRTIADMLLDVPSAKSLFSEIDHLLRMYFTIPISTATAERSFSSLRCIKTFLRSTMTEARLNNVLLLHAHKDQTDVLNLFDIAETFASLNLHRREFLVLLQVETNQYVLYLFTVKFLVFIRINRVGANVEVH